MTVEFTATVQDQGDEKEPVVRIEVRGSLLDLVGMAPPEVTHHGGLIMGTYPVLT